MTKMRSLGCALAQCDWCPYEKGRDGNETERWAREGVCKPSTPRMPPPGMRQAWNRPSRRTSGSGQPCRHLHFGLVASRTESAFPLSYATQLVALGYGSPGKPWHHHFCGSACASNHGSGVCPVAGGGLKACPPTNTEQLLGGQHALGRGQGVTVLHPRPPPCVQVTW